MSLFDLSGRVAAVTGAASGIGQAVARALATQGADVALHHHPGDPHDVAITERMVAGAGRRSIAVAGDVRRPDDVDELVRRTVDELGGLDVMVANAAIARRVPSAELDDDAFRDMLEVNLMGAFRCLRAAIGPMRSRGGGRLIVTSSIAGAAQAWPEHAHYTAAKAGLVGLVRTLAVELAGEGITVNAVAPGLVRSPQTLDEVNSIGEGGLAAAARSLAIGRVGGPDDLAPVYAFLASAESAYLTGQVLVVDGGLTLQW